MNNPADEVPMGVAEMRALIIRPALQAIDLWTPGAEDLLLGTAIQESGLKWLRQQGGGPALGYWQMEPATHDDCWSNFLRFRPSLATDITALIGGADPAPEFMVTHTLYASAMARIRYYRSRLPLPAYGDVTGYAHAWKQIYNTPLGAGTEAEFIANWHRVIGA